MTATPKPAVAERYTLHEQPLDCRTAHGCRFSIFRGDGAVVLFDVHPDLNARLIAVQVVDALNAASALTEKARETCERMEKARAEALEEAALLCSQEAERYHERFSALPCGAGETVGRLCESSREQAARLCAATIRSLAASIRALSTAGEK